MSSTRHSSVSEAENLSSSNNACNRTTTLNNTTTCNNNSKDKLSNEQTSAVKQELPKQQVFINDTPMKKNIPLLPPFQAFREQKFVQPIPAGYGHQIFLERPVPIFADYFETFKSRQASTLPCSTSEYVSIRYLAPLNMVKGEAPNRMGPGLSSRPVENPSIRSAIPPMEPIFMPNIPPPYHYGSRGQLFELNNISVDPKNLSSRPVSQFWNMTGGSAGEAGDGINDLQNEKNFYDANSARLSPQTRFMKMFGMSDTDSYALTFSKFASIAVCLSFILVVIVIGSIMGSFFAYPNEGIISRQRNLMIGAEQNATKTIGNNDSNTDFLNTTRIADVTFVPRIITNKNFSDSLIETSTITTSTTTTTTKTTGTGTNIYIENSTVITPNEAITTTSTATTTTTTTPISSSSISVGSTSSTTSIKPTYSRVFANKGRYNFNSMLARTSSSVFLNGGNV